jgi:crotonobetainyl-CoA:carnitine CoA-transferase CaiB-like acyl-CoA transferase
MTVLPLSGITVLELSHTVMGPACGLMLADMGADVIRIEPTPDGDPTRTLKGFATGFFAYFNRNKRSIVLDLKSKEGLKIAHDLAAKADVLLENFGAGGMDRLGLGWEELHKLNPRLIYCALKGFLPGPYGERPATDEIIQHMVGLPYMTGPPGQPLRAGTSVIDITGGLMGAMGILAALRQRDQDGKGRLVDSALFESGAFLMGQHLAQEAASGVPVPPMTQRGSAWGIYEAFPTGDGKSVFLGLIRDKHWVTFCKEFACEEWLKDERFADNASRVKNRLPLRDIVTAITKSHDQATLVARFLKANLPFSPVNRPSDLFDDPHLNQPGRLLNIRMPGGKPSKLPPLPFTLDGEIFPLRLEAPGAGEHTDAILHDLGYQDGNIAELKGKGLIR